MEELSKESIGSWIIHHGRKVVQVVGGGADFPTIDESAKAANLLNRLTGSDQDSLSMNQVRLLAVSAGLNPNAELPHYMNLLKENRLIDITDSGVETLGLTTRAVLSHTADIFQQRKANKDESAVVYSN